METCPDELWSPCLHRLKWNQPMNTRSLIRSPSCTTSVCTSSTTKTTLSLPSHLPAKNVRLQSSVLPLEANHVIVWKPFSTMQISPSTISCERDSSSEASSVRTASPNFQGKTSLSRPSMQLCLRCRSLTLLRWHHADSRTAPRVSAIQGSGFDDHDTN